MNRLCFLLVPFVLLLNACVSLPGGGQRDDVRDSGPTQAVDLSHVKDAVPRSERRTIAGNKTPYTVLGKTYYVVMDVASYKTQGVASWYGRKFHGRNTSNGEVYDMYGMTAAHKTLPIPSYVKVTNLENGKQVIVRVNDRGPFHGDRIIDLSYAAASKLGFAGKGTAKVEVELVNTELNQVAQSVPQPAPVPTSTPVVRAQIQAPPVQPASQIIASAEQASAEKTSVGEVNNTFVQAGAFSSEASAVGLKEKLAALINYPVFVESVDAVSRLFKVRIGPIINDIEFSSIKQVMSDHNLGVPLLVYE